MATEGQNFTKWEQDSFVIQFTITDAEVDFQSGNYAAYWSMASASEDGSYILQPNGLGILSKSTDGDYGDIEGIRWIAGDKLQVTMSKTDTEGLTIQDYYHELVIAESDQTDSVVVATGTFTLKNALFPDTLR